jgi:hypothetical protein
MILALAPRPNNPRGASSSRRGASARQSRWRANQRVGLACYQVTIDAAVIDLLVRLNWFKLVGGPSGRRPSRRERRNR